MIFLLTGNRMLRLSGGNAVYFSRETSSEYN